MCGTLGASVSATDRAVEEPNPLPGEQGFSERDLEGHARLLNSRWRQPLGLELGDHAVNVLGLELRQLDVSDRRIDVQPNMTLVRRPRGIGD